MIVVDYGHLVAFERYDSYDKAAIYAIYVGQIIGTFFATVFDQTGLKPRSIHLIGYSIGGHVMAYISRQIQALGLEKLGRISALDPARPW